MRSVLIQKEKETEERRKTNTTFKFMYRATAEYHVRVRIQSLTKHTPSVYISYGNIFWETELYKHDKQIDDFRQLMRKLFGPTRSDHGYWRIKTNQEIDDILKGQNIIGFIKKQRLKQLGRVERMAEDNNVQKIKRWKPMFKRPIGRPKTRWEDDVLEDIRSMNVGNQKKVAQNRDSWKNADEQARTLYRLQRFIRNKNCIRIPCLGYIMYI